MSTRTVAAPELARDGRAQSAPPSFRDLSTSVKVRAALLDPPPHPRGKWRASTVPDEALHSESAVSGPDAQPTRSLSLLHPSLQPWRLAQQRATHAPGLEPGSLSSACATPCPTLLIQAAAPPAPHRCAAGGPRRQPGIHALPLAPWLRTRGGGLLARQGVPETPRV